MLQDFQPALDTSQICFGLQQLHNLEHHFSTLSHSAAPVAGSGIFIARFNVFFSQFLTIFCPSL